MSHYVWGFTSMEAAAGLFWTIEKGWAGRGVSSKVVTRETSTGREVGVEFEAPKGEFDSLVRFILSLGR